MIYVLSIVLNALFMLCSHDQFANKSTICKYPSTENHAFN